MNRRFIALLTIALFAAATSAQAQQKPVSRPAPPQIAIPKNVSVPTPVPSPVLPAVPTVAPGYSAPNVQPTSAEIVGVTQQPFVGLSLNDAIGMALSKNTDIAVAAANVRIASYQIEAAKGAYDVRFQIVPSVRHDKQAPQNAFFSGPNFGAIEQNTQSVNTGVNGLIQNGGNYSLTYTRSRVDDNTLINSFNPYYLSSLNAALNLPLLKGRGITDQQRTLQLAVVNASVNSSQALTSVSTDVASVENAYWDLVSAWRNVAIQEDALKQAILQQQSNVRLARAGQAANIDAVESSTQVAVYQDNVFAALQAVSQLQNQLKSLILNDPADPIWRANILPTSPVQQLPAIAPLDQLLSQALQNRPEVTQIAALQQQAGINLAYARNQALPQVDVNLGYQTNGFAGIPNAAVPSFGPGPAATPPPYLVGQYGTAFSNMSKFPAYQAGVTISTPIGNHTAKADLAIAQEQQRIAALQGTGIKERIEFEVRNAAQNYQSALSRLYAARQARQNAEQVYASELRKFRNGASTTFLVLQRQIELVQDEGRELQAQTNFNKAIVELQRVDGSILSANNVQLTTVGKGTTP